MRRKVGKMKSKAKLKVMFLITLGIIFAISPVINNGLNVIAGTSDRSTKHSDEINIDAENIKLSAISGKIHIDNNWTAAKTAGICTGEGISSDPYVIDDLIIDGGGNGYRKGSCILIEYSNVFFRIENCTVSNSDYGIRLNNANNGQLINNNASNNRNGIKSSGFNNTISGNVANNNDNDGIYISGGDNNISGNTANNNDAGIILSGFFSQNNTVSGNYVNNNYNGIKLQGGNHNMISGNLVNYNFNGIELRESDENNIIENTINNNNRGIYLYSYEICIYGSCELTDRSKCNYISDNSFSNNSRNILGTQIECNPGSNPGSIGGIPGYNLFFLLGTISVVAIVISIKLKKFNK